MEALAARGEVHVSLPYEPGRAAFASLSRTVADLGALARGDIVELAPGSDATSHRRSRTSSGTSSTTPPRRHRSTARCASSRAPAAAPHSSSSPRPSSSWSATESPRRRSRSSARRSSVRARRSRPHSAHSAYPSRSRRGHGWRRRRSDRRCSRLLRFAWGTGTRRELFSFLRTPYAGLAAATSTSSKAGCVGAPSSVATARRGDDEAAYRPPAADARAARRRGRATRCGPRGRARRWRGTPTALALLLSAPSPSAISAPPKPRVRSSTSSSGYRRQGSRFGPRTCSPLSTGPPCAATQPASPGGSRCSTSRAPARGASRPSS